jgi:hypothetical protein
MSDKTVTMSRELAESALTIVSRNCTSNWSARVKDGIESALAAPADELRAVLAQEAGKCEPVAELLVEFFEHGPMAAINWFTPSAFEHGATKVYTSPPAPVSVVLPPRKPMPDQATFVGGNTYFCKMFDEARGYNQALDDVQACLGKVKELNP